MGEWMTTALLAAGWVGGFWTAVAAEEPAPKAAEPQAHRADWLHKAKWGVMYHYCSNMMSSMGPKDSEGKPLNLKDGATWNKTIEAFDVPGLAKELKEIGVGYFMITSKHCGNPIAPNAAYEKDNPGLAPKRDLIMDLADELARHDIRLMLYFATGMGVPPVPDTAKKSAAVIEEWSKRYGKKVSGWWFDNNVGNQELQKLLADAARSGNPDSIVGFSPPKGVRRNSPYEDYTAGNQHAPGSARCNGRFVDGAQWHILTYLSGNWGGVCKTVGRPRFPDAKAIGITTGITSNGGAITWDVAYQINGRIDPAMLPQLKAIGQAVERSTAKNP